MFQPWRLLGSAALLLLSLPAVAQQQPDHRLAGPMLAAQQSMLALREEQLRVLKEDTDKRIAELEKLCGEPCKPKPEGK